MRLVTCDLSRVRIQGGLSLRDVEACTGVNRGMLSYFERGRWLPADRQLAALEGVYGPRSGWFGLAILADDEEPRA
jgi:transcriptional regulator with XRE-family HTH domain